MQSCSPPSCKAPSCVKDKFWGQQELPGGCHQFSPKPPGNVCRMLLSKIVERSGSSTPPWSASVLLAREVLQIRPDVPGSRGAILEGSLEEVS